MKWDGEPREEGRLYEKADNGEETKQILDKRGWREIKEVEEVQVGKGSIGGSKTVVRERTGKETKEVEGEEGFKMYR